MPEMMTVSPFVHFLGQPSTNTRSAAGNENGAYSKTGIPSSSIAHS